MIMELIIILCLVCFVWVFVKAISKHKEIKYDKKERTRHNGDDLGPGIPGGDGDVDASVEKIFSENPDCPEITFNKKKNIFWLHTHIEPNNIENIDSKKGSPVWKQCDLYTRK